MKNILVSLKHRLEYLFFRNRKDKFVFEGKEYNYFYNLHNATWNNERKIEIPIFVEYIKDTPTNDLLEVGNTLHYYMRRTRHTVLDKYEVMNGVINKDIVEFKPLRKFKKIISISTIEHIGNEGAEEINPYKSIRAIDILIDLLEDNGTLLFSIPCGYHPKLDQCIKTMENRKNIKISTIKTKPFGITNRSRIFKIKFVKIIKSV